MNFQQIAFERSFGTASQLPPSDCPEICFAGRSNVGKSSLINRVVGRKALARVSAKPGKTVTINFYRLDAIRLVDLPGYGFAKVPFAERDRWSELMEGYFHSGRCIPLVLQLIDMRHSPSASDLQMLHFLNEMQYPFVIILTKSDKLNQSERVARLVALQSELAGVADAVKQIPFSAQTGEGVEEIRQLLETVALRKDVSL